MKRALAFLLTLTALLGLALPGLAAEPATNPPAASEDGFDPSEWPAEDERFFGKSWEDVIGAFLDSHGIPEEKAGLVYYNTVTGEELSWNGDKYFTAASTYKVPINLIYADRVSGGEMSLDDEVSGVPLRTIQRSTLVSSNNYYGEILIHDLGSYTDYKAAMTPYLCPEGEELDHRYDLANAFTPRQLCYSLRLLYDDPGRFPDVLDYMLQAQPDQYFRLKERRFPIAHKYGYFVDLGFGACNDIGIVWTEEPIILVMMTNFVNNGVTCLADYCTLMCDYSQYMHARHLEEAARREIEEAEAAERAREEAERLAAEEAERLAEEARLAEERRIAEERAAEEARIEEERRLAEEARERQRAAEALRLQKEEGARRLQWVVAVSLAALMLAAFLLLRGPARWIAGAVLALLLAGFLLLFRPWQTAGTPTETAPPVETLAPTPVPTPEPTPTPIPQPTPEPTPEPIYEASVRVAAELEPLLAHPELRRVDAEACEDYAALAEFQRAMPDCEVVYTVPLGTLRVSSLETELTLPAEGVPPEELAEKLAWLPRLEKLDLLAMDLGNAVLGPIADAYPEIDILWTVRFKHWTVRSDLTVFSTRQPWPVGYRYTDSDLYPLLRWCRHLRALDIGHNDVRDLEPIGELRELKVLIIGDNEHLTDISPLAKLTELEYMEMFLSDEITDFTPLGELGNMVDLCVGYCAGLRDISFVERMPKLKMGWFANARLTEEQRTAAQNARPETKFLFFPSLISSTSDGWRMTDRNVEIRRAFSNWENVVEFRSWDDVDYVEGAQLTPVIPLHN